MIGVSSLAVLLATVALGAGALVKPPSDSGKFELLILHNNDMHARFEQTSRLSGACTLADREAGKCYGGFPRVAHVVKEARMAAQSGQGPPVLYLNAGDTYTGTAWFTIYKWKIAAEFINALQPDAVSLGNSELKKGSEELSPFIKNVKTKILASNIILKSTQGTENIQKSIIFDIEGVKVGVVGYLSPDSVLDLSDIEYIDEVIALKEEVAMLQTQGANIIIALGHSSEQKDIEIATEVEGLDLVIAGQLNEFHWDGTTNDEVLKDAIVVTQESGRKVTIIPSFSYNKYLGKVYAEFNTLEGIINSSLILLDSTVPQDEQALQIVKSYANELTARDEKVLGKTAVVLDGETCKVEECNLGNLIVDAIVYTNAIRFVGTSPWTNAPIAVIPGGDISRSIAPSNRPADITLEDLLLAIQSTRNLVTLTMNGEVLNQVLEHSLATYSPQNPTGQMLQFSGIRAEYDLSKEPGSRLVNSFARCGDCFVPEFYVIENHRSYGVIMPADMADGGYGYEMLVGLEKTTLTYDEVTATAEYVELRSPVYPEVAGRIVLTNYENVDENVSPEVTEEPEELEEPDNSASGITSSFLNVGFLVFALYFRH